MLPCGPDHFLLLPECVEGVDEGDGVRGSEEALGISRVMRAGLTYQAERQELSLAGGSGGRRARSVVSLERAGPGVGGGVVLPLSVSVGLALELLLTDVLVGVGSLVLDLDGGGDGDERNDEFHFYIITINDGLL